MDMKKSTEEASDDYADLIVDKYKSQSEMIDKIISQCAGKNFNRIGAMELNILRTAVAEILIGGTYQIVINEFVEISKKYGEAKTYRFVNAVLSCIVKKLNELGK